MALEFVNISHTYGANRILSGASFSAAPGEITCLLGQSGCGKTTLLRLAAGLLKVQQGSILLGGDVLASENLSPPPEARDVGLVFQEAALFPHLTAAQNIGFGVAKKCEKNARISEILGLLGLTSFASRYPHTLSGGQQQRVALGRAMAPSPGVLLLDEPFASLDIVRRRELRREARRALKQRGCITLLVTHDPDEALDVGDKIAVMDAGRIIQCDDPAQLYNAPVNAHIASVFGEGQEIEGSRVETGVKTAFGVWSVEGFKSLPSERELSVVARPEALTVSPAEGDAKIEDIRRIGLATRVLVTAKSGDSIWAHAAQDVAIKVGDLASVNPISASIFAFPRVA
ncbi:MAG: ABC transporter ATP-binding protein [Pseudomonadota bacterium]